jgi:hypothetical protein
LPSKGYKKIDGKIIKRKKREMEVNEEEVVGGLRGHITFNLKKQQQNLPPRNQNLQW